MIIILWVCISLIFATAWISDSLPLLTLSVILGIVMACVTTVLEEPITTTPMTTEELIEEDKLTPMEQCVADGNVWLEEIEECI